MKWDRETIQLGEAAKVVILTSDANLLAAQTSKYNLPDLPRCWTTKITRVSVCELPLTYTLHC